LIEHFHETNILCFFFHAKGTVQGKEQKQGSLYRDLPFINKPLWSGADLKFTIKNKVGSKGRWLVFW